MIYLDNLMLTGMCFMCVYELELTGTFKKEIKGIDKQYLLRLDKKIQTLKELPKNHGKPLRYPLAGIWELRFEKRFRVLYKINEEKKIVYLVSFKHKDEMAHLFRI